MQDYSNKTKLVLTRVEGGQNKFEIFIEDIIEYLQLGDSALGVITSALMSVYDLLYSLAPQQSCEISSEATHDGVAVQFKLEEVVFEQLKFRFDEMINDVNVQKIKMLSDNLSFNDNAYCLILQFETKSIYAQLSKDRASKLKAYFRQDKEKQSDSHDISKRS